MKSMPKAYSYLRFSTPEQSKGDSFRRQSEAARAYATRHGLELDTKLTFRDLGISAFRGKNREKGALGVFLKAVASGQIRKGSYLLVEDLDRLSRDSLDNAYDQFRSILKLGINIATLDDEKLYTPASLNNLSDMIRAQTRMDLAHEESRKKSIRIGESWRSKRDKAQSTGKKLTGKCPAWLSLASDRKSFIADKSRVKVIRRIFDLTLDGHGKSVITRRLNGEGVATFGESQGWHPSYVQKILENEAVCGVFQPMRIEIKDGRKARVADGAPITDYFPSVIPRATFEKAKRSRASRRIATGSRGESFTNLFGGIAKCGTCGSAMHYVYKGDGTKGGAYLTCSNARRSASNCKAPSWRYGPVEALTLLCIEKLDYAALFPELSRDSRAKLQALEDSKLEAEAELAQANKRLENIIDALQENAKQPALMARLNTTQASVDNMTRKLAALELEIAEERDRGKNAESDFEQTQDGLERLDAAHGKPGRDLYDLRSRLHQLLKRTVSTIAFHSGVGAEFAPKTPGDWRGRIEIGFQGTKVARALYVTRSYSECRSVPMRDGKPDVKKAVTLKSAA